MITDAIAELIEARVVTGARKSVDCGRGHRFPHGHEECLLTHSAADPAITLRDTRYTHDPVVPASQHQLVAINSATEVDLTGQANTETAAGRYIGAVGGAVRLRAGRRPVWRRPDHCPPGHSPDLRGQHSQPHRGKPQRAGDVSRADTGLIVTEYGIADLRGLTLAQRREQMIAIAHPDHRQVLSPRRRVPRRKAGPTHDHAPGCDRRAASYPLQPMAGACVSYPLRSWTVIKAGNWRRPRSSQTSSTTCHSLSPTPAAETPRIRGAGTALQAWPVTVPGFQIDRRLARRILQAIITAAMMVQTGAADVVLAGGVESMSNVEHYMDLDSALGRPVREPVPL